MWCDINFLQGILWIDACSRGSGIACVILNSKILTCSMMMMENIHGSSTYQFNPTNVLSVIGEPFGNIPKNDFVSRKVVFHILFIGKLVDWN